MYSDQPYLKECRNIFENSYDVLRRALIGFGLRRLRDLIQDVFFGVVAVSNGEDVNRMPFAVELYVLHQLRKWQFAFRIFPVGQDHNRKNAVGIATIRFFQQVLVGHVNGIVQSSAAAGKQRINGANKIASSRLDLQGLTRPVRTRIEWQQ